MKYYQGMSILFDKEEKYTDKKLFAQHVYKICLYFY